MRISVCIGCGCDDLHACKTGFIGEQACSWLAVDRRRRVGVCSSCPGMLPAWKKGRRELTMNARVAVEKREKKRMPGVRCPGFIPPRRNRLAR